MGKEKYSTQYDLWSLGLSYLQQCVELEIIWMEISIHYRQSMYWESQWWPFHVRLKVAHSITILMDVSIVSKCCKIIRKHDGMG